MITLFILWLECDLKQGEGEMHKERTVDIKCYQTGDFFFLLNSFFLSFFEFHIIHFGKQVLLEKKTQSPNY